MSKKIFITIFHDFIIFCLSFFIALLLRLDWSQSLDFMNSLWSFCILYAAKYFSFTVFWIISWNLEIRLNTRNYINFQKHHYLYVNYSFIFFLIFRLENIPRSFPVLLFIVSLFGVTGPRVFYRFLKDRITKDIIKRIPVFIVGDSNSSESFIRLTKNQKTLHIKLLVSSLINLKYWEKNT